MKEEEEKFKFWIDSSKMFSKYINIQRAFNSYSGEIDLEFYRIA